MPICEIGPPIGPIENGITYIVRPRIEPANTPASSARISSGSRQLFVGPASAGSGEQMKVRSSTRATSPGSERARYDPGRSSGLSSISVPAPTSLSISRCLPSAEPSTHSIASGAVSAAMRSTKAETFSRAQAAAEAVSGTASATSVTAFGPSEGTLDLYVEAPWRLARARRGEPGQSPASVFTMWTAGPHLAAQPPKNSGRSGSTSK